METSKPKLSVGIEYPQRRFGLIAIEKGFITVDDLWEAIVRQKAQDSAERRHIGMILKDLGHLTISQIDEVLEAMAKGRRLSMSLEKVREKQCDDHLS